MTKICDMIGVAAYDEGFDVELHRHEESGRLVIRAFNEGGYNCTDVDLFGILEWAAINSHLLDATGYAVVPKKPTQKMESVGVEARWRSAIRDANNVREIYRAMIEAAKGE